MSPTEMLLIVLKAFGTALGVSLISVVVILGIVSLIEVILRFADHVWDTKTRRSGAPSSGHDGEYNVISKENAMLHEATIDQSRILLAATKGDVRLLAVGDKFIDGDEYGYGFCFVIGTKATSVAAGDLVTKEMLCYLPRRPIHKP